MTATLHEHSPPPPANPRPHIYKRARAQSISAFSRYDDNSRRTSVRTHAIFTRTVLSPAEVMPPHKRASDICERARPSRILPATTALRYSSNVQYLLLASCRAQRTVRPRSRPRPTMAQARWWPPRSERRRLRRRSASATRRNVRGGEYGDGPQRRHRDGGGGQRAERVGRVNYTRVDIGAVERPDPVPCLSSFDSL